MPGNFPPQDQVGSNNSKPQILMALNYLQSQMGQQPLPNFSGQPQGYNVGGQQRNFPMQGQYNYPNPTGGNDTYQQDPQKRSYSGYQSQNRYKNDQGYKDRGDRDRNDKGYRNERNDRGGYKGDRDRGDRSRTDRGDRNERGDRGERRFGNYESGKRMDSSRDRKFERRSRSRSRDNEKREGRKGNFNNYNRDRNGGDRFSNRDNSNKPGNRYPGGSTVIIYGFCIVKCRRFLKC